MPLSINANCDDCCSHIRQGESTYCHSCYGYQKGKLQDQQNEIASLKKQNEQLLKRNEILEEKIKELGGNI